MKKLLFILPIFILFSCGTPIKVSTKNTGLNTCRYIKVEKGKYGVYALSTGCYGNRGYQVTGIFLPENLKKAASEGAYFVKKWFNKSSCW